MAVNSMRLSRRGMFFTLIAMTMGIAILVLFIPTYQSLPQTAQMPSVQNRVLKANHYVQGMEGMHLERALQYTSYNALRSLIAYTNTTNKPLRNLQVNFTEVLMNGTINKQPLGATYNIHYMDGNTMTDWLSQMANLSRDELHLVTNITMLNIAIYQSNDTGYHSVGVDMEVLLFVDAGVAVWNTTHNVTTTLDISRFYDPYYEMNAQVSNKITFSNETNWTASTFFALVDTMDYVHEENAPSFLSRFENKTTPSTCCGVESFINPLVIGINDQPWSYADYCYYGHACLGSTNTGKSLWNITGVSNPNAGQKFYGFKLEYYHINMYTLTPDARVVQV